MGDIRPPQPREQTMSDIIDPQRPVVPPARRDSLVVDETLHQASLGASELRSAAYPPTEVAEHYDLEPVIVRSSNLEFKNRGQLMSGFAMVAIAFIGFWIPVVGSLAAGLVGGVLARRWGRAFLSAAVATVAVPGILVVLNALKATGDLRFLLGLGFGNWMILHVVSLFVGAAMGVYSCPLVLRSGGLRREPPEHLH